MMRSNMGYFGGRLRSLRRRMGKTQLEVAYELKQAHPDLAISQANVSHWEKRDAPPRSDILSILAGYFGVHVSYFFDDTAETYEARKPMIASYLKSLQGERDLADGFLLHTEDNSSGNQEILDTTDNLSKFYRSTDLSGK
ncbi:MAG: helix-turn-helix transcriptional regulator [Chloroflexi bacterium]|nr:helix-turn-helix transcriptional regulator [Chloroflexota bacterium]